ncbi:Rho GTPase activation protein, partial [Neoconidiobolus thromboides FSU 785]
TVFNTSLKESVKVSSHQISLKAFPSYSVRIPTIIYVCTEYLRAHGTESKGVFRVSGSLKRMQNLQLLFEDTPKYGSNLDLKALGFTPFDVANTLTRYLTSLVEPVIPNELFHSFRSVLEQESVDTYKVEEYKKLLQSLEPDNLNLLLYLLDFFMEFNQYADATLMPYSNLASIFQPSILCLPEHVHLPEEYKKSQKVVEFL